jgi:hypothetical protein
MYEGDDDKVGIHIYLPAQAYMLYMLQQQMSQQQRIHGLPLSLLSGLVGIIFL